MFNHRGLICESSMVESSLKSLKPMVESIIKVIYGSSMFQPVESSLTTMSFNPHDNNTSHLPSGSHGRDKEGHLLETIVYGTLKVMASSLMWYIYIGYT